MPINLKTHIQMQSKIMKKRQRKKNNKNVFIPLIPVEMTEEEVKQIFKTRGINPRIGVICIIVLVMEFMFQMSFPKWGFISMVVLLVGGAIYGFYIHDYFQVVMCVADIGFFVCV